MKKYKKYILFAAAICLFTAASFYSVHISNLTTAQNQLAMAVANDISYKGPQQPNGKTTCTIEVRYTKVSAGGSESGGGGDGSTATIWKKVGFSVSGKASTNRTDTNVEETTMTITQQIKDATIKVCLGTNNNNCSPVNPCSQMAGTYPAEIPFY